MCTYTVVGGDLLQCSFSTVSTYSCIRNWYEINKKNKLDDRNCLEVMWMEIFTYTISTYSCNWYKINKKNKLDDRNCLEVVRMEIFTYTIASSWWYQGVGAMDADGNRLQNSCSPRHWGHSTMHECPQCLGLCGCLIVFVAQVEIVNCHTHGFIPRLTAVCKL